MTELIPRPYSSMKQIHPVSQVIYQSLRLKTGDSEDLRGTLKRKKRNILIFFISIKCFKIKGNSAYPSN